MPGVQFPVEHGLGDAVIGHPHKVCEPTKLRTLDVLFDASLCASLLGFSVWYHVLPLGVSDAPQATHVELFESPYVSAVWCPFLTLIQ